ncbi:uncharacterized protein LOC135399808 [Ornithodoros turicata]|uniref:uncharacterized protein LOC135399808 n=1 Tax=Ornithodoros turicata TaxID=34597 RepID=UPI0031386977
MFIVRLIFLVHAVFVSLKAEPDDMLHSLTRNVSQGILQENFTGLSSTVSGRATKARLSKGDTCHSDADCGSELACLQDGPDSKSGYCNCPRLNPVYIYTNSGYACVPGKKLNEDCLASVQCEASNSLLKCNKNICSCPSPNFLNLKDICVQRSGYGRSALILTSIFLLLAFSAAGIILCVLNTTSTGKCQITTSESRLLENSAESESRFPRHRLRHPLYPPNPAQQRMLFSRCKAKRKSIPHADTIVSDNILTTFCCKSPPEACQRRFLSCHQFRQLPGGRGENVSRQCFSDGSASSSNDGGFEHTTDNSGNTITEGSSRSPFKLSSRLFRATVSRSKTSPTSKAEQEERERPRQPTYSLPVMHNAEGNQPKREDSMVLEVIPLGDLHCMSALSVELSHSLSDLPSVHLIPPRSVDEKSAARSALAVGEKCGTINISSASPSRQVDVDGASINTTPGRASTISRASENADPELTPPERFSDFSLPERTNTLRHPVLGHALYLTIPDEDTPSPPDRPVSVSSMVSKLKSRSPDALSRVSKEDTDNPAHHCAMLNKPAVSPVLTSNACEGGHYLTEYPSAEIATRKCEDLNRATQLDHEHAQMEGSGIASYGFSIETSTMTQSPSCIEYGDPQPEARLVDLPGAALTVPIYERTRGRLSVSRSSCGGDRQDEIRRQISAYLQRDLADALLYADMCPAGYPDPSPRVGVLSIGLVSERALPQMSFQLYEDRLWSSLNTLFRSVSETSDTVWLSYTANNSVPKEDDCLDMQSSHE